MAKAINPITRSTDHPITRFFISRFFPLIILLVLAVNVFSEGPQDIIAFLNQTIHWHQLLTNQQQLVNEPSDVLFLNDNRQIADQVSRLSFDFARERAQSLGKESNQTQQDQAASNLPQYKALAESAAKTDQKIKEIQREIESMKQQLANANGQKRHLLKSTLGETESELALLLARRASIQSILDFVSGTAGGAKQPGLQAQIEEMARALPASATETGKQTAESSSLTSSNTASVVAANAGDRKDGPNGIFALAEELIALKRKLTLLDNAIQMTDSLVASGQALRAPLMPSIRELMRRGDELMNQPDSQDPIVLAQQQKELDGLTAQFKQLSAAMLPLGKQAILLDLYKKNSSNWRVVVSTQYKAALKSLLIRLAILIVTLCLVLVIAHLWRNVTFRYIQDPRRRHQFLVLRRIIVWAVIIIIVVVASVSGLGGMSTFAGLLTAGVAVALQNVILAVVGYFFLIGKHGIRVGDRIQVSGVIGNVVDIGLIRMHLMELARGPGAQPTGRIVAFSNAVVFRTHAGLYKQVPGSHLLWHEVTIYLPPDSDYRQTEEKMLQAVNKVFADYQEKLAAQLHKMEDTLKHVSVQSLHPESRIRLTGKGLRVTVRYPVDMQHAREMDDRITREVLAATEKEPARGLH
ncbi:MAG TPA: mechanosensitive ion channel domain-containing protein [Candidatus Solibacter sp.]|nr:mechanosensitive ion channel domain-containing protein [Candidatus Solibacter sp.]